MRVTCRSAVLLAVALLAAVPTANALGRPPYVALTPAPGAFPLVDAAGAATLVVDAADWPGVIRAVSDLQADVRRVTDRSPAVADAVPAGRPVVIIGTVGRSALIDRLIVERKIDAGGIAGKWESFFLETVADPMPGVSSALVIAGSDKRGTIYGIYDLSEQIGVSPWYWWADVAPAHQDALYVQPGKYQQGEPSIRYRGIFLNDERPDLDYWVRAKYGEHPTPGGLPGTVANFNRDFYARIFEVLLRLKANYLWPAMWNNAFAEDDPDNPRLADEYGIVMGTSHQEPMMRAQKEWDWHLRPEHGNWNYGAHPQVLERFWREGIRARKDFENLVTIGLRGENDTAMAHGPAENIRLLEQIVARQRAILSEEVDPDVTRVPQLWCLYKEVQGYYETGLRVPDDVTLLWAEDNWGNVRRLPTPDERQRSGGAGVYYHFDYHGGPRSYQWINTSPIPKIWEQMSLSKQYGADRIWIVNVGHFKSYAFPMEFFLSLAWDTDRWTGEDLNAFTRLWAAREFGPEHAAEIADIMATYSKYNGRRKPELIVAGTYSLVNFREAERIVEDYNALAARAEAIMSELPAFRRDAFYQLVLFPTKASAQVNELYVAAAKNALYAEQGRASANDYAARTRALFAADAALMAYFNKTFAGGRWDHFMDQSHIGYTSWRDPPENTLDAVRLTTVTVPEAGALGVAVDGSASSWPGGDGAPVLPTFDALNQQRSYVDVFNRGRAPVRFTAAASEPWIQLSQTTGTLGPDARIWVSIDWTRAPVGAARGTLSIRGGDLEVVVGVVARRPRDVTRETLRGFAEGAGFVSIEPEHFTAKVDAGPRRWIRVEDYGRTLSGMRAEAPAETPPVEPGGASPRLEYQMYLSTAGPLTISLSLAPTLNFVPGRGLHLAVSVDDEAPRLITAVPEGYNASGRDWERTVRDNARAVASTHHVAAAGYHTLKIWMVDPAVVVQKIVATTGEGEGRVSYLGPPESFRGTAGGPPLPLVVRDR
jgi:Glycosyl hydrolase family 115/Gylcosyl hydrolase family 115 C-terminal domain